LNRKRENLRIQKQKQDKVEKCTPIILQKSRDMVKNRSGKIEDRLIAGWKSQKAMVEKEIKDSQMSPRIPQISQFASQMHLEKPVVDRLMLYKKIYHDRRAKAIKSVPEFSHSPQINSYSTNISRTDLYSARSPLPQENSFSFKPQLNSNSLKMAAKLGSFGNRTLVHSKSISTENYSFHPEINKTSSISTLRSSSPRWNQLYNLNLERRERLELLRKAFAENDRDFECTFHPKTTNPSQSLSISGTVQRLNDWEHKRQSKINSIRNSSNDKEYDECTFKPSLYSKNTSSVIDFSADNRKNKKSYAEIHKLKYIPDKIEWQSEKVLPLFISDINSNEYDDAIKELHDLLHISLK
jgi:hypothetical protein